MYEVVTPAKAGGQKMNHRHYRLCIPNGKVLASQGHILRGAFAGMTDISDFIVPDQ